jgi:single-strand DNA-binding protein
MMLKVQLIGFLGHDPDMRFTPQGNAVCNFSVATNRRWKDNAGNLQEETTWVRVTTWGALAENCNQFLVKGSPVFVEGDRLQASAYTPRDGGDPRASLELTAQVVRFLPGGPRDDEYDDHRASVAAEPEPATEPQPQRKPARQAAPAKPAPRRRNEPQALDEDDIPF